MHAVARWLVDLQTPEGGSQDVIAIAPARRLNDGMEPVADARLVVSASSYARLLSLADQAPLEGLQLAPRTLDRAKTLGYNQIGQVRSVSANRLVADFGVEHADELLRALFAFGLRQQPQQRSGKDGLDMPG
jgi:hypothetical protein